MLSARPHLISQLRSQLQSIWHHLTSGILPAFLGFHIARRKKTSPHRHLEESIFLLLLWSRGSEGSWWMASRSVDMASEWLRKASILRIIVINPYGTSTVQERQLDFNPKEDFCQLFSICPLPPFLQHPLCCSSHLKPAAGDLQPQTLPWQGGKAVVHTFLYGWWAFIAIYHANNCYIN